MNFTIFFKAVRNVLLNPQRVFVNLKKVTIRNPMLFKYIIIQVNLTAIITVVTLMPASAAISNFRISLPERIIAAPSNSSITIIGKVSDEKNNPLTGVSVKIKGTTKGTLTDIAGKYTITANNGDILVFSILGFVSQEITIGGQTGEYNIQLKEDAKSLTEVVVTALNIKKEKSRLPMPYKL